MYAVADYLKKNPAFFEDYADVVAQISFPIRMAPRDSHRGAPDSRCATAHDLEQLLRELIRNGTENDEIGEKLHRSTLALFAAPDLETTLAVLSHSLKEDFAVPQVAIRLWTDVPGDAALPEFAATTDAVREYADRLRAPSCGPEAALESREWFVAEADAKSFAYLPLRTEKTFGVLALASGDAHRFHAGIGTVYLLRLAELASVAIARFFG